MPPRARPPAHNEQGMPHTSTTDPFADIQVVPMFILSPKVIQRLVRRQIRHPCCIHRMTNEGQTGEQKLKIFSITAPLPPLRWGKNGKRGSGCTTRFKRRGQGYPGPAASWPDGQKRVSIRHPSDDSFASVNSGLAPGQARSLAGFIRSATPRIRPVTISLSQLLDGAYTVDSDNEGQDR